MQRKLYDREDNKYKCLGLALVLHMVDMVLIPTAMHGLSVPPRMILKYGAEVRPEHLKII